MKNLLRILRSRRFRITLFTLSGIALFVLAIIWNDAQKKNLEGVCEEGIYELDSAFIFEDINAFFCMVCEPPTQKEDLATMIDAYLSDERIVDFYERSEETARSASVQLTDVWVVFIKPSDRLGIGEIPEPNTILSYFPEDNTIAIVHLNDRLG